MASDEENPMDVDKDISSDEDSNNDSSDEKDLTQVKELEAKIAEDVYQYSNHVEIIKLYSRLGELELLREARKRMSKHFPLSSELWMSWLKDEIKLISTDEQRSQVIDLFEQAVQDYLSVDIWQEYGQFAIGCLELKGVDWVRSILERAVNQGGIHGYNGVILWDIYREFENLMLVLANKNKMEDSFSADNAAILEQQKRIANLFKRQLACPLLELEKTYTEFKNWLLENNNENNRIIDVKAVEYGYKQSLDKLSRILTFEESLMCSEPQSRLSTYQNYLAYEMNEKEGGNNPTRVQCLYERAVADLPLDDSLWLNYIKYVTSVIHLEEPVFKVIGKAIRNCPWISKFWVISLEESERYNRNLATITSVLENALQAGFPQPLDYLNVWMAYILYLRRLYDVSKIKGLSEDVKTLEDKIRTIFEQAYQHVVGQFGINGDPNYQILYFWAYFEGSRIKNLEKMRLLWNDILRDYGHDKAAIWLSYISMERELGDTKHLRKLYSRALLAKTDWPESIGNAWLDFEKQEGDFEDYKIAEEKVEEKMKIVIKLREKEAMEKKKKVKEKNNSDNSQKRKPVASTSPPPLKQPKFASAVETTVIKKGAPKSKPTAKNQDSEAMEVETKNLQKSEEELMKERGVVAEHDPAKDERTVFISNLDYTVGQDIIQDLLKKAGVIEEIRLVKNFKGLSKGFCYVVFTSKEGADAALKMDRTKIDNRPMFISECSGDKEQRKTGLRFKSGVLEKNKLFVRNIPYNTTEDDLKKIFGQYGELEDVRIAVYKSGTPKGIAYIEYKDEVSAATALIKTDNTEIGDKKISVALSKPPPRKTDPSGLSTAFSKTISLGGPPKEKPNSRTQAKTKLSLLPRSLQVPVASTTTKPPLNNNTPSTEVKDKPTPKSNQDFRNMLLGNK